MPMMPGSDIAGAADFVIGSADEIDPAPVQIFAPERMAFLAAVSGTLFADKPSARLPDVAAFAFWCRRPHLDALARGHRSDRIRVGLGAVFHIAPANVPINFAYSLAFGLLAGNTCIVRLPSRDSESATAVIRALGTVLAQKEHRDLRTAVHLIRYPHDDQVTGYWLQNTLGRVIWGGDETIAHMRSLPAHPRSREIVFADRYSFTALGTRTIRTMDEDALAELCSRLANDVYLMDQRACSSPHLLAWIGSSEDTEAARTKFWLAFEAVAGKHYTPEPIHAMDKFVDTCREIIEGDYVDGISMVPPTLTRIRLSKVCAGTPLPRGYFGTLHEARFATLADLAAIVDPRWQTMTAHGFDEEELTRFVADGRLTGIDRIVPVGDAHAMDAVWDGHDMVFALSRIVDLKMPRKSAPK